MLWRVLRSRGFLAIVSVGLILAGVIRYVELRTPDRPRGSWEEIRSLATRDDLNLVFVLAILAALQAR
jgi:hypothetical protein